MENNEFEKREEELQQEVEQFETVQVVEEIEKIEKDKKLYEYKRKGSILSKIFILIDIIVILIVLYFGVGYVNFMKIKDGKEPLFVVEEKTYSITENNNVTVYDNKLYKVVKQELVDDKIIYSLKLWFQEDVE